MFRFWLCVMWKVVTQPLGQFPYLLNGKNNLLLSELLPGLKEIMDASGSAQRTAHRLSKWHLFIIHPFQHATLS